MNDQKSAEAHKVNTDPDTYMTNTDLYTGKMFHLFACVSLWCPDPQLHHPPPDSLCASLSSWWVFVNSLYLRSVHPLCDQGRLSVQVIRGLSTEFSPKYFREKKQYKFWIHWFHMLPVKATHSTFSCTRTYIFARFGKRRVLMFTDWMLFLHAFFHMACWVERVLGGCTDYGIPGLQ